MSLPFPASLRATVFGLLLLASSAAPADGTRSAQPCTAAPWIKLEVVASEIAGNPIGIWIEIDQQGCVLSHYPWWRRDAGTYQREMSAAELTALRQALQQAQMYQFDAAAERQQLQIADQNYQKAAGTRTHFDIAGGDIYRLQIEDGKQRNLIEWRSPAAELRIRQSQPAQAAQAKALGADGLQRLVDTIRLLQAAASDPRKQKIAEVTP